jgi:ribonuclease R
MTSSTATDMSTLLMIDSQHARDRDDAFSVVPRADGRGWTVEVHIAGVADVVGLGSVADEQAFLRAETRYLRSRTIPMLGDTAEQAATLTTDARRTSLQVTGTLTTGGRLVDVTVGRGQIPSGRCVAVVPTSEGARPSVRVLVLVVGEHRPDCQSHLVHIRRRHQLGLSRSITN